ncbi:hypothetical protein [Stenotrophomonas sp.]|nr:hypothetical protein [Stenotrophomonas sp.]
MTTTQATMSSDGRVGVADPMEHNETRERAVEQAMADLAQQAQDLGMGYE